MTKKDNEKDSKQLIPKDKQLSNDEIKIINIFQTTEYVDTSLIPWYRQTWVILTFLFTPIFFIGIYLLLTQKHYNTLFKCLVIFLFVLAIFVTIMQMNGTDLMKYMPFYRPLENTK